MTAEQFARLPLLIPRRIFREITGLPDRDIDRMVAAREIGVFKRPVRTYGLYKPSRAYRLYPKAEAARLAGFKV